MRKTWFAAWALAGMTAGYAGASAAAQGVMAANGMASPAPKASWTERFTAPVKKGFASLTNSRAKPRLKVDPRDKEFDPDKATPELYVGLAQMSHRGGDIVQARQMYQKALAKDPDHLEGLLGAARMEDREGQLDVALMLYKRAAAAHPRNATALNDLALCFARRGDLLTASQVLEEATRIEPSKPLYRNNLAKVLVEMNRLDQATSQLAAVHPPSIVNYNMAVLLSERGRMAESTNFLTAALAIDPRLEPARAMLAQQSEAPGPAMIPADNGIQAIVQSMPPIQPVAESRESILPTPEAVATIPWKPPVSGNPYQYPATNAQSPAAAMASPPATAPVLNSPALLPPVN